MKNFLYWTGINIVLWVFGGWLTVSILSGSPAILIQVVLTLMTLVIIALELRAITDLIKGR